MLLKKADLNLFESTNPNISGLVELKSVLLLPPATGSRCTPDLFLSCSSSRDESEAYLAGLGTVGMEVLEQVPKLDAVVVPAAGQYGLLASTAAAIKHLNSRILVIVSGTRQRVKTRQTKIIIIFYYYYCWLAASAIFNVFVSQILCSCLF